MAKSRQSHSGRSQISDAGSLPTPEDPQQHEPTRDPPIYPEHDDVGVEEIRQAQAPPGIEAPDPSPDSVVNDGVDTE